jgi:MFS family permease
MQPGETNNKEHVSRLYRNYLLLMLTLLYVFNFIDWQLLVILQESIKKELHLSDTQLGLLSVFTFAIFYVTLGIPIARIAEKGGRRNTVAASLALWSMMTMNQIGDPFVNLSGVKTENKFGFGFSIITENGSRLGPSKAGTYAWGGVFSTSYWVDLKEDMFVIIYRQMWGPHVADTDKAFKTLVYRAIND